MSKIRDAPKTRLTWPEIRRVIRRDVARFLGSGRHAVAVAPGDLLGGIVRGETFDIQRAWRGGEPWDAPVEAYVLETALAPLVGGDPGLKVKTRCLAEGDLFAAAGVLYQVVEAGPGTFNKAVPWQGDIDQAVALNPASVLARHYPVVAEGVPVPACVRRADLFAPGSVPLCFRFPAEAMAFQAASLDQALARRAALFARPHGRRAYVLTDGMTNYRYYYYSCDRYGLDTALDDMLASSGIETLEYTEGPPHWRLVLSSGGQ